MANVPSFFSIIIFCLLPFTRLTEASLAARLRGASDTWADPWMRTGQMRKSRPLERGRMNKSASSSSSSSSSYDSFSRSSSSSSYTSSFSSRSGSRSSSYSSTSRSRSRSPRPAAAGEFHNNPYPINEAHRYTVRC